MSEMPDLFLPVEFVDWAFWRSRNLILVAVYLARESRGDDVVFRSTKTIGRFLGVAPATARNLLRQLDEDGWIRCEWDRGRNRWKITLTGLRQSPPDLLSERELVDGEEAG